jgi:membrane-bound lytic murein transglycosylase D
MVITAIRVLTDVEFCILRRLVVYLSELCSVKESSSAKLDNLLSLGENNGMKKQLFLLLLALLLTYTTPVFASILTDSSTFQHTLIPVEPAEMLIPESPEICTGTEQNPPDFKYVEMFNLELNEICTFRPLGVFSPKDVEMCRLNEPQILLSEEPVFGPAKPIMAGLDLASYSVKPRANRAVKRYITIFTKNMKESFANWLSRSRRYIPMMKDILREEGLPEDLAYLPLVESGFNPRAYSRRKAAGPWQFIPATARRYGLKIDWWVDERRDPVKSTRAAASYLKRLYEMFGSWSLAMAAYNAGEARIKKALRRTRSNDYWSLLRTRYIRRETKNYVPKFIAARLIAANPEKYGFYGLKYQQDFVYDEVTLDSPLTLDIIAKCAETTTERIKDLNPELRRWSTPPNVPKYTIRIPKGKKEIFFENLSKIPPEKRFGLRVYTVKKGDTVGKISMRTGVPASVIMSLNKINKKALIRIGQKLYLPTVKSLRRN